MINQKNRVAYIWPKSGTPHLVGGDTVLIWDDILFVLYIDYIVYFPFNRRMGQLMVSKHWVI